MSRAWPAVPGSVSELRESVASYARSVGVPDATVASVKLAVSEAATNVVMHAYSEEPGSVHVRAEGDRETLHVVVSDDGGGMLPRPDSPGLGLGLPLIAQLVSDLHVESTPSGGTALAMSFRS